MRSGNRRTATRVRDGRVQKKNNWAPDRGDYFAVPQEEVRLDRRAPGPEFRHVVTIPQLRSFVALLADWDEVAEVRWTKAQARAFQLLHILPHELGHHHDRITTRSRRAAARGERYAEHYPYRVLDAVWPSYARRFGI